MLDYTLIDGKLYTPEGCEINVAHHCNLSCRACSHLSPVFKKQLVDPAAVQRDLGILSKHYHARFVKILGGEPLLHPGLIDVVDVVRASRVADRILVCTNGVLLPRMSDDFWRAVDDVEVSVYPDHELAPEDTLLVEERAREHDVTLTLFSYTHFRESFSSGTSDARLVHRIYSTCQIAHVWRCHTVIDGYFFKCPQSVFFPRVSHEGALPHADGVAIEDDSSLAEELLRYLVSPEPLGACRRCLGSVGRRFPHEQSRRRGWVVAPEQPSDELLDEEFLRSLELAPSADDGCSYPIVPATLRDARSEIRATTV